MSALWPDTIHPAEFFEAAQAAFMDVDLIYRHGRRLVRVYIDEDRGRHVVPITAAWLHLTADRLGILFYKLNSKGDRVSIAPTGLGVLLTAAEDTSFPLLPERYRA